MSIDVLFSLKPQIQIMKIFLLGATGRTGKLVLTQALTEGYEVNCLARKIERISNKTGLKTFEGNPENLKDLETAMLGCDAIISVLNISRKSDFPWSSLRTPPQFLSSVMQNVVSLASNMNIKRVVICSAWGVAETRKDIPFWFRWAIDFSNIGVAYKDHERQEEIIAKSSLDWTIVRPVGLTNFKKVEVIEESITNIPKPSLMISRSSVARFMLECLQRDDLIAKKIVVSKA
jgi:putative NADH-flavin reductase